MKKGHHLPRNPREAGLVVMMGALPLLLMNSPSNGAGVFIVVHQAAATSREQQENKRRQIKGSVL